MTPEEAIRRLATRPPSDQTEPRDRGRDGLVQTEWSLRAGLYVRYDFEPREQFSASQLDTASCLYKWGLRYLWGLRRAEFTWAEYESAQTPVAPWAQSGKSSAFGKEGHTRLEDYFNGRPVTWTDAVGRAALMGLSFLPTAPPVLTETPIIFDSRTVLHTDEPVSFVGYVDLNSPDVTYDYKFTSDPKRWAKSKEDLELDGAACLYGYDAMQKLGHTSRAMRWVYMASRGDPFAKPVDFVITLEGALPVLRLMVILAVQLRHEIRDYVRAWRNTPGTFPRPGFFVSIDHLPKNTHQCKKYGGCDYHHSKGGPCAAELAPNATLIPASKLLDGVYNQKKENNEMPTLAERLAQANANPPPAAPQQGFAPNPNAGQGFGAPPFQPGPAPGFPPAQAPGAFPTGPGGGFPPAPPAAPAYVAAQAAGVPPPGAPAPAFPGFPGAQAPAAAPPVAPAQMNPPEAQQPFPPPVAAAPAPMAAAPAAPVAEAPKKRGRKPKAQADVGAAQAFAPQGAPPIAYAPEDDGDIWTVTLVASRSDGTRLEVPASPEVAEHVLNVIGQSAKAILG